MASGPALKAPKDIIPYLTNLEERSVLFVDEIHRIPKAVEEYLYTAMEDFRIDIVLGDGVSARTLNLQLNPFTLIGATTRAGMLSGPMRDRFQIREHLGFYSIVELREIVERNAEKLSVSVDAAASEEIARRSRGTPRIANNRLRWIRDYAQSKSDGQVNLDIVNKAMLSKKRVCSVGTTCMRSIESSVSAEQRLKASEGWTNKFIFPPYDFHIADSMITNFHLPKSSLVIMASAFGGSDLIKEAYEVAVKEKYRFFSYGDAMLIL